MTNSNQDDVSHETVSDKTDFHPLFLTCERMPPEKLKAMLKAAKEISEGKHQSFFDDDDFIYLMAMLTPIMPMILTLIGFIVYRVT